jgi:hypothetical protein
MSTAHDFDFFMGRWNVHGRRLRERLADCDEWLDITAVAEAWPLLGGLGNVDTFETDFGGGFHGASIRFFHPDSETWTIYWADSRFSGPLAEPVVGKFENNVGIFEAEDTWDGVPILCRYTWSRVDTATPRWEQAFSTDGGETWETNWINDFTRIT